MKYKQFVTEIVTTHFRDRSIQRKLPSELSASGIQPKVETFLLNYFLDKYELKPTTKTPDKEFLGDGITFAVRFNFDFTKNYLAIGSFRYDRYETNPYRLIISWITTMDLYPNHKNDLTGKHFLISVSPVEKTVIEPEDASTFEIATAENKSLKVKVETKKKPKPKINYKFNYKVSNKLGYNGLIEEKIDTSNNLGYIICDIKGKNIFFTNEKDFVKLT